MTVLVNQQPKKPDPPLKAKRQTQHKSLAERAHGIELEITGVLVLTVVAGYTQGFGFAKKCLLLSYGKAPNAYGKGINDIYFVCFWIVAFSFLQTVMSKYIYHPIALWGGIKSDAKRQRLAEQLSTFFYYSTFWLMGMYIMYHSPYWLDTSHFWIDYPHMLMTPLMKAYYLMQTAFYIQQIYAINVEKWRKDHFAMVFHHIIAITLLASSYYSNFTRIGNAVLCCMDLADVLLSLAKVLKYSNRTTLCDVVFGLFAVAWPVTRHGFFLVIFWATAVEPIQYLDMKWEPEKGKYFTILTQKMYLGLFTFLSVIMFYWFSMIVKVIINVLSGNNAEDTRSDDEEDDEEEDIKDLKSVKDVKGIKEKGK